MRYLFLLLLIICGCASQNHTIAQNNIDRVYVYQGIFPKDQTIVFQSLNEGGFKVISTDIELDPIGDPLTESGVNIEITPVNLFLFVPHAISTNDYLVNEKSWVRNECTFTVVKSLPTYLINDTVWQHTIISRCGNDTHGMFVFSSRFGLKAFFVRKDEVSHEFKSGYLLSTSVNGLASGLH